MMRPIACAALLAASSLVPAQTLTTVLPRGAQPGSVVELTCYGRRLSDTIGMITFRPGIEVLEVEPQRDDRVRVRVRLAPDCPLGAHPMMLHTERGITRACTFDVAPLRQVEEKDADEGDPQLLEPDVTLDGRIESEDVDWYAVDAEAGVELVFELVGIRLGDVEFDPVLELFDASGASLVRADDSAPGRFDPVLRHTPTEAGRLRLSVRDLGYGGSSRCHYRLHFGTFPRPVGAVPCGGPPGSEIEVRWVGADGGETVRLPDELGDHDWYPRRGDIVSPTPIRLRVGSQPVLVEGAMPSEPPSAPFAWHGVVGEPGETDEMQFAAKKGERIEFTVHARSLRSPLDSVLRVRDAGGRQIAASDDAGGPDSRVRFSVPDDGVYRLQIHDHLRRGGDTFFYRVESEGGAGPMLTQERVGGRRAEDFGVAVPRGGRNATVIAVGGRDRRAGIRLGLEGLPEGVSVEVPEFADGVDEVPVLLHAAVDAPLSSRNAKPTATAEREPLERPVRHAHDVPLIRVENNRVYTSVVVDSLPVVVTNPVPFAIEATEPTVPLVQGASLRVPFRIVREEGCDATIVVRALWSPPGVGAGSDRLRGSQGDGEIRLNARGNAATGRYPMVLTASATIDGVAHTVATPLFELQVDEPWVTAKVGDVRLDQGATAQVRLDLSAKREFDGEVLLELDRLPRGVEVDVPARASLPLEGAMLTVRVAADAAADRHRNHVLLVRVPSPGGPVLHEFDAGEIRIDEPLPESLAEATQGGAQ